MTNHLTRIAPLQAGLVLGIFNALLALIFMPFMLLVVLGHPSGSFSTSINYGPGTETVNYGNTEAINGIIFVLFLPVLELIVWFIGGIILAALYNLVAKWTGGIEFDVGEAKPSVA
jgi:hypothetical protein